LGKSEGCVKGNEKKYVKQSQEVVQTSRPDKGKEVKPPSKENRQEKATVRGIEKNQENRRRRKISSRWGVSCKRKQ